MEGDRKAIRHRLQAIPWWPGRFRSAVSVPAGMVTRGNSTLTPGVTTMRQWDLCPDHLRADHGDEIFAEVKDAGESTVFLFNPPIPGEAEAEEGDYVEYEITDKYERSQKDYDWPSVMLDQRMILDLQLAGGGDANRLPVPRGRWVEGARLPTWTTVRVYVSRSQPPDAYLETDVPRPTHIRGDYYGQPVNVPPCLHPEVILESAASDDATIYDTTPSVEIEGTGNILVYPATNHSRWLDHDSEIELVKDAGLYRRTVVTREAPYMGQPAYI